MLGVVVGGIRKRVAGLRRKGSGFRDQGFAVLARRVLGLGFKAVGSRLLRFRVG